MDSTELRNFLFPTMGRKLIVRMLLVIACGYILFGHLLIPLRISGASMEPTYANGAFAFCWRLSYLFSEPQRFDVVTVRFAGRRVMLLKRVVAFPGETVEFKSGNLYINNTITDEPHIRYRSNWNLPPRTIAPGHLYVVGDNRSTSPEVHKFGEVAADRIIGKVFP